MTAPPPAAQSHPLVTGLSFAPPKASLSDDKVNKFNVIVDRRQPGFGGDDNPKRPHFPDHARTPADKAWLPRGKSASWTVVSDDRRAATAGRTALDAVERWADRLGFVRGSVVGAQPTQLLDRFEQLVPAVPLIAVGTSRGTCV